jgi:hypothetical protein
MTLERVLDEELLALAARVKEAHNADEVSRAIERAFAAVVRQQLRQMTAGEIPDTLQAMRVAVRQQLEALMPEHSKD